MMVKYIRRSILLTALILYVNIGFAAPKTPAVKVSVDELSITEGGAAKYTVRLATKPPGPVKVTATSSDSTIAELSRVLEFNRRNWNKKKKVNVRIPQDDDSEDETTTISHAVEGYGDVTSGPPITIRVADDDVPNVLIQPTSLAVAEGGSVSYGVRLETPPNAEVTITPSSSNEQIASVSGALTFDSTNWQTTQFIEVIALIDDNDRDDVATINHDVQGYDGVESASTVEVSIEDVPPLKLLIDPTSLVISEDTSSTYEVWLDRNPGKRVTVVPKSSKKRLLRVGESVRFNRKNWERRKTITLKARNDEDVEDEYVQVQHEIRDANVATIAPTLNIHIVDDDDAGSVILSASTLDVIEGQEATYNVSLSMRPSKPVKISLSSSNKKKATVSPSSLTFRPNGKNLWSDARTITVSGIDDANQNDENVHLSHRVRSSDPKYATISPIEMPVVVIDDDLPEVMVSPVWLDLFEGSTGSYQVWLMTRPERQVTVRPVSSDESILTVSSAVKFGRKNWNQPKTIVIQTVDDADRTDDSATISHQVKNYDVAIPTQPVQINIVDDDHTLVTYSTTDLQVVEGGEAWYEITLSPPPTSTVRIDVASSDSNIGDRIARFPHIQCVHWDAKGGCDRTSR